MTPILYDNGQDDNRASPAHGEVATRYLQHSSFYWPIAQRLHTEPRCRSQPANRGSSQPRQHNPHVSFADRKIKLELGETQVHS